MTHDDTNTTPDKAGQNIPEGAARFEILKDLVRFLARCAAECDYEALIDPTHNRERPVS